MLLKMRVRPYLASDKSLAHSLYGHISDSFTEFGLTLAYVEEEIQDFHYETMLELFEKNPETLIIGHLQIRDALSMATTPGLGSAKFNSVIISSLEGLYAPAELVGVVWHEIGENIFHLHHHKPNPDIKCAMGDIISRAEVSRALFSTRLDEFSRDVLERYKTLPATFCSECLKKISINQVGHTSQ